MFDKYEITQTNHDYTLLLLLLKRKLVYVSEHKSMTHTFNTVYNYNIYAL